jgi:tRNA(His) guanylyltransferase
MKEQYENRTRYSLPRRTYTIIRIDGKAFHTFTKGCVRPLDGMLAGAMDETAENLCKQIPGTQLSFTQSDEISLLVTDFDKTTTEAWFDGNIQKITSVAASIATANFNHLWGGSYKWDPKKKRMNMAYFDARVFTIPDHVEVANYFIWRQKDADKNAISMIAQHYFCDKDLDGKSTNERIEMLKTVDVKLDDYPQWFYNGRVVRYETTPNPAKSHWRTDYDAPVFTKNRDYLEKLIPRMWAESKAM